MAFIAYVSEPYLRDGIELDLRRLLPCLIQKDTLAEAKEAVRLVFKDRRSPDIERMLPGPFRDWEEGGYYKVLLVPAKGDVVFLLGAYMGTKKKDQHVFFV